MMLCVLWTSGFFTAALGQPMFCEVNLVSGNGAKIHFIYICVCREVFVLAWYLWLEPYLMPTTSQHVLDAFYMASASVKLPSNLQDKTAQLSGVIVVGDNRVFCIKRETWLLQIEK